MPSPAARLRVEPDERLSGRDPHTQLECLLDREVADRKGGSDRALRVVLVRSRRAEQRHNRIPELNFSTVPPCRSSSARTRSW